MVWVMSSFFLVLRKDMICTELYEKWNIWTYIDINERKVLEPLALDEETSINV